MPREQWINWIWLLIAGAFEISWIVALKESAGFSKPLATFGVIVLSAASLFALSRAAQAIPIGIAYAVWTGIGAVGAIAVGIALYGEQLDGLRLVFLCMIVFAIVGLKLTSSAA